MKPVLTCLAFLICMQLFACKKSNETTGSIMDTSSTDSMMLKVIVGSNTFNATVYNGATATAFKAKLPLTINMVELNGNEKYFDLPNNLPSNASNPGNVQAGDLMLYGSNTLVLFYRSFATSYSYTPLGRIDNSSGLTAALGSGNVTVTFALQ
jgi:hypothetical protein